MSAPLMRLVIYTRRIEETAAFYRDHFGYAVRHEEGDRIVELVPPGAGAALLLHPAAKGQRTGQAQVKLVFDVADVAAEKERLVAAGVAVGPVHPANGYCFANLKDPAGNSVSISSRALR